MTRFTISLPGKFDSYFSGTGPAQGQTGDEADVIEMAAAYRAARITKRGRGYTMTLTMSADAWNALAEWASTGATLNGGWNEPEAVAEAAACREVLRRIRDALGAEFVRPDYCPAF